MFGLDGFWVCIAVTALALAAVVYSEFRDRSSGVVGATAKVIASAAFLVAAVAVGAWRDFFGQSLFIALAWSFIGDVMLIARGASLAFGLGLAAFLMSHVGYIMVFRMRGVDMTAVVVALAVLAIPAWLVWRWLERRVRGGMRTAVGLYIAVISAMVAFAVGTTVAVGLGVSAWPLVAALLFYASDLFVARHRFVIKTPWNRAIGLPLYYAAQYAFIALLIP